MLLVGDLGPGGSERQLTEVAKALDKNRFSVHAGYFRDGMRRRELADAGVELCKLNVTSFRKLAAIREAGKLVRYIQNHQIRIIHTFDYPLTCFAVPIARACGVPIVLSSHRGSRELIPTIYRRLIGMTDLLVDGIVTNCRDLEKQLIHEEGVPRRRVHLCFNGIDTARFPELPSREQISTTPLTLGSISVFRPEKNFGLLLEAVSSLPPSCSQIRVLLVGGGSEEHTLRKLAERLNITNKLTLLSAQNDIFPALQEIDIFVLPSTTEALSNSLMEAMACGRPVIASRVGGTPELVDHEKNGLLFESQNVTDLRQQMIKLIQTPCLRQQLGCAARKTILERFSIEQSARRMGNIYQEMLEWKMESL